MNWVLYALGLYLAQKYDKVIDVLDSFEKSLTEKLKGYERSELHLFRAKSLEGKGDLAGAIKVMTTKYH
jgi:hypothetical protein